MARLSGGSLASTSETPAASTVRVQVSPSWRATLGSKVKLVGPPLTDAVTVPEAEHSRLNQGSDTLTGSLNVTLRFEVRWTSVAPSAGEVAVTVGASSATT